MSKKLDELVKIVEKLRSPSGCPWDKKQTHKSLKPHVVEETYEVIDAIDKKNYTQLCEELGDLLLQVVLHSQLAAEKKKFKMDDVIHSISQKLIRRHPHVFQNKKVKNLGELFNRWEKIKSTEHKTDQSILSGIPQSMPALARAEKVQEKAARVGFDWDKTFKKSKNNRKISDEIGDMLFILTNIARELSINAEGALQTSTSKFINKFKAVEKHLKI